jgi:hypothetical protein
MRLRQQLVTPLMIAALFTAPVVLGGCGGNRSYDPYYGDYHRWNGSENGYYLRWEGETQRSHLDFNRRSEGEQHSYYDWRHRR